jgi:hypothetical protein
MHSERFVASRQQWLQLITPRNRLNCPSGVFTLRLRTLADKLKKTTASFFFGGGGKLALVKLYNLIGWARLIAHSSFLTYAVFCTLTITILCWD